MTTVTVEFSDGRSLKLDKSDPIVNTLKNLPYLEGFLRDLDSSELDLIKLPISTVMGLAFLYFLGYQHPKVTYHTDDLNIDRRIIRAVIAADILYTGDPILIDEYISYITVSLNSNNWSTQRQEHFYYTLYQEMQEYTSIEEQGLSEFRDPVLFNYFLKSIKTIRANASLDDLNNALLTYQRKLMLWCTNFLSFTFLMNMVIKYPVKTITRVKDRYILVDAAHPDHDPMDFSHAGASRSLKTDPTAWLRKQTKPLNSIEYTPQEMFALDMLYFKYTYYLKYPNTLPDNDVGLYSFFPHSMDNNDIYMQYLYAVFKNYIDYMAFILDKYIANTGVSQPPTFKSTEYVMDSTKRLYDTLTYVTLVRILDYLYYIDAFDRDILELYSKILPTMNGALQRDELLKYGKWALAAFIDSMPLYLFAYLPVVFFGGKQNELNMFSADYLWSGVILGVISQRLVGKNIFTHAYKRDVSECRSMYTSLSIYPNHTVTPLWSIHQMFNYLDEERFHNDEIYRLDTIITWLLYPKNNVSTQPIRSIIGFCLLFTLYEMTPELESKIENDDRYPRAFGAIDTMVNRPDSPLRVYFENMKFVALQDIVAQEWFNNEFIQSLTYGKALAGREMPELVRPTTREFTEQISMYYMTYV